MVPLVAAAGAAAGALADVHPSGVDGVDRALAAAAVGVTSLAAARARRWTWFVLVGVTATFAETTVASVVGIAAILATTAASLPRRHDPLAGAAIGAAGAWVALHLADGGRTGGSLVVGLVAFGPVLWSGCQNARRHQRRVVRRLAVVAGGAVGLVVVTYGLAVLAARSSAVTGVDRLRQALDAARHGDLDGADERFDQAADALERASSSLDAWWAVPARGLPIVGHNARAVAAGVDLASHLASDVQEVLQGAGDDRLGMRSGRIDPVAFDALEQPLGALIGEIADADARADSLANPWLLPPVADSVDELRDEIRDATHDADVALDGLDAIPTLLGAGGEARYLVLFVTPVEARATGFPGNYAELAVRDGRFEMVEFGRISDLAPGEDDTPPVLDLPAEFLARYARFGIDVEWRSATLSPDFPVVADLVRQLYAAYAGVDVDGVLSVDPTAIAALLEFTGPVAVPQLDEPLTAATAEDFLLREQYLELPDSPGRIDALESLGRATFDQLVTGDLPSPQRLASTLGPVVGEAHLRLVSFDPTAAAFLRRVGLDHAFESPEADGVAVTSTNAGGGKLDLFLHRSIDYEAGWDPASGAVTSTLTVTLRNDSPSSGLPDYVIGDALQDEDLPPGTNRSYVSIYSPLLLDAATLDGEPVALESTRERGYNVYGVFVDLDPDGGTAVIELSLSGQIPPGDTYTLQLWPQVLPNPDDVHAAVTPAGFAIERAHGFTEHGEGAVLDMSPSAPSSSSVRVNLRRSASQGA